MLTSESVASTRRRRPNGVVNRRRRIGGSMARLGVSRGAEPGRTARGERRVNGMGRGGDLEQWLRWNVGRAARFCGGLTLSGSWSGDNGPWGRC